MEPEPDDVTIIKGNFLACTTTGKKTRCNSVSIPRSATPMDILDADEKSFFIGEFNSVSVAPTLINKFGSSKNTYSMDFLSPLNCKQRTTRGKTVLDCNEV